jgi:hypothetical protein
MQLCSPARKMNEHRCPSKCSSSLIAHQRCVQLQTIGRVPRHADIPDSPKSRCRRWRRAFAVRRTIGFEHTGQLTVCSGATRAARLALRIDSWRCRLEGGAAASCLGGGRCLPWPVEVGREVWVRRRASHCGPVQSCGLLSESPMSLRIHRRRLGGHDAIKLAHNGYAHLERAPLLACTRTFS